MLYLTVLALAFVRKVYSILSVQLGLTMIISAVFMSQATVKTWIQTNIWFMYLNLFATFIVLIGLFFKRKEHPINIILLGLFTTCESFAIGTVVSFYDSRIVSFMCMISPNIS